MQPSMLPGGSSAGYGAPGRAGGTPVEAWTQCSVAYDSRHSYPPAVGSPAAACYQGGCEWWDDQQAGIRAKEAGVMRERARYSDLPGTRYQEELTRLLLRDAASEGGGIPDVLMLKDQHRTAVPATATPPCGSQIKPQEEPGAGGGNAENRLEFFGETHVLWFSFRA